MAACLIVPGVAPRSVQASAAEPSPVCSRAAVLAARDAGAPQVRAAAEQALLGTEAEVCAFVHGQWSTRELVDREILATQLFASGGPAMQQTLTPLLDAEDPEALGSFLTEGWREPWQSDQEIRINQLAAMGGPQVKQAAQVALDAGTPEAQEQFLQSGWVTAQEVDVELRVNQAHAAGGPRVKEAAAAALDDGRQEALIRFLDVEWGVAAARDHEQATVTDLLHAAEHAGSQARAAMGAATAEADRAEEEAALAKKAAATARQEAQAAGDDRRRAEAAAAKAAQAARRAASAAGAAVGAANDAAAAARTAASAAVRVAMAASLAERKAAEASSAAAAARTDRDAAGTARQKAYEARRAADYADDAQTAMDEALAALDQVTAAITAAGSAVSHAIDAASAAQQAAEAAVAAGADAATAYAAAERARAAAARAQHAAEEAVSFARYARDQAVKARNAARDAAVHARAAAEAAEDAAEHAGEAADAADRARQHADDATTAAEAARAAAQQAQEIFAEARRQDRLRLDREREQLVEAARDAARFVQEAEQIDVPTLSTPRTQQRPAGVVAAIEVATNPDTPGETAVARAREAALGLVDSSGSWTREAARTALVGHDEQVLAFAQGGLRAAEGMDDRTTLAGVAASRSLAMLAAAQAVSARSDAEVAAFLAHPDYPERREEDELETTRVLAAAREAGDAHTIDAATVALDDGSAAVLHEFLETGQYAAREADAEIKVSQIFQSAPEGSELRINAEVALEGPPAYRKRFLEVGRYEAAARDRRTTSHEETMSSLVLQVAEVAAEATENEKYAWAEAARAAGAAEEAAVYADEAADAASTAGRHAQAANEAAVRASESAVAAKNSANIAQKAAAQARGSAEAAARSATWAAASHSRAIGFAQKASGSALQAWNDAIEAGEHAREAAVHAELAYQFAYDAMIDEVMDDAAQKINLPALHGGCFDRPAEEAEACEKKIWEGVVKLVEADFEPYYMVYINADLCTAIFGEGLVAERCLSHAGDYGFLDSVFAGLLGDSIWSAVHLAEPFALFLLDIELRYFPDELCGKSKACSDAIGEVMGYATGELPDIYSQEYWDAWHAAWKEYWTTPGLTGLARDNALLIASYRANACLDVEDSGGMSPAQCVQQRIRDALDDLSWSPPTFDVGGRTVHMSTDQMVDVLSRQTWDYFGALPSNVQRYFAPTDTVTDLDRYLAQVVQHNEAGIREFLEGHSSVSAFSYQIDGYIYVISLQRDGTIVQFYRR
ncbi:ALF repeat-containing protein [Promicromonospora sp. NPDC057488]|uniref:ALF repeat-containing protein n=1 Tax=Promicromonospora sp. NPDC057488 TaxID=3346147 RepID=UPI00366B2FAC